MSARADELYALLPAVYRIRDAEQGGPLRELVEVIAEQVAVLDESLEQFFDDQFIETCAEWVAPYIGDLVGYRPLHGVVPRVASPRAEVANTIRYRRRKGTAAMLEQLARDVTGWPARAVEFFERLVGSQYMNHIRRSKGGTPDLRDGTAMSFVGTAFDDLAHTADVRPGRHNIPNVGIFLWRIAAIPMARAELFTVDGSGRRFRFDPLGADQPIYGRPRTETEITHIAEPADVPLPLSRRSSEMEHYGAGRSVMLAVEGGTVPADVSFCDLSDSGAGWAHEPAPGSDAVAIDPVLGRVCFPDPLPAAAVPLGTYHYGSALEIGGGGYDRGDFPAADDVPVPVTGGTGLGPALTSVAGGGIVEIQDSRRYAETPAITVDAGARVTLRASNRARPVLVTGGPVTVDAGEGATVVLDGLLLTGGPVVLLEQSDVEPRHLVLRHCTLPSLVVEHPVASVTIERCVLGPVETAEGVRVAITDSVVDAGDPDADAFTGGALTLDESTVVGQVHADRVDISNSLLLGLVLVRRRQIGCVRFSYLPPDSRTPARYRCQPDDPANRPLFTSLRYGDPGYAQLRPATPDAIRRGADDEGEMGVTHHLHQPQRETNLRIRLDEYLRFGLSAGLIYAS